MTIMTDQQIYHVYCGHDGIEYRELGHSSQLNEHVVNAAGKLCEIIGTPLTTLADRPFLLSYPDKSTGYLFMICCSSMNDFSNRSALFFHVLTCSLDNAKKYGINAFSMYDVGNFVMNYQPGNGLNTAPITCKEQSFCPTTAPFVLMLSENDKPVVLKASEPGQLVRSLLTGETVNRLKWAEFTYKELPGFDLYVKANPDLNSKDYIVRDANGKVLSNLDHLTVSDKPTPDISKSTLASSDNAHKSNNVFTNFITYAMVLALTVLLSFIVVKVADRINALENRISQLENKAKSNVPGSAKPNSGVSGVPSGFNDDVFVTKADFNRMVDNRIDVKVNKESIRDDILKEVDVKYVKQKDFEDYKNQKWFSRNNTKNDLPPSGNPPPAQVSSTRLYSSVTLGIQLVSDGHPQNKQVRRFRLNNNQMSFSIGERLDRIECTCTITDFSGETQYKFSGTSSGRPLVFNYIKNDPYPTYSTEIKPLPDMSGKTPPSKFLYIDVEGIE